MAKSLKRRSLLFVACLCAVGMVALQAMATSNDKTKDEPATLKLSNLEIVNKKGDVVFSLGTDAVGGAVLKMSGPKKDRFIAGLGDFGQTGLAVYSSSGRPLIELSETASGNGQVRVMSKDGTSFLDLGFSEDGKPMIRSFYKGKVQELCGPEE